MSWYHLLQNQNSIENGKVGKSKGDLQIKIKLLIVKMINLFFALLSFSSSRPTSCLLLLLLLFKEIESVRVKTYLSTRLTSLSLKLMSKHSLCALVLNRILETGFGWGRKSSSVAQSYPTLCNPMDFSTPVLPVHYLLLESTQTQSVMPSNHLILCHPLLPPSIFPSIRVFSN